MFLADPQHRLSMPICNVVLLLTSRLKLSDLLCNFEVCGDISNTPGGTDSKASFQTLDTPGFLIHDRAHVFEFVLRLESNIISASRYQSVKEDVENCRSEINATSVHTHTLQNPRYRREDPAVIMMLLPAPDAPSSPPGSAMVLGSQPSQQCNFENPSIGLQHTQVELIRLHIEVQLTGSSSVAIADVSSSFSRLLESNGVLYCNGPFHFDSDSFLCAHVARISVCDVDEEEAGSRLGHRLFVWEIEPLIHVYQLSVEAAAEDEEGEDNVPSYREWELPSAAFDTLWENLIYDVEIKQRLVDYASSVLLFAERGVNANIVSFNRVVLLHGPPGTGKTSLCQALAQKLAIRFSHRFPAGLLIEVNAHSLFSKWFSESGKLVAKLFAKITEMVDDPQCLVFVLIDEVESLTAARQAAAAGNEPSDSIRAVNALLTQLDQLKQYHNVMVLTTSNITEAIDLAFVDRADIKAYIGPPSVRARYEMLRSCLAELRRVGILTPGPPLLTWLQMQSSAASMQSAPRSPGSGEQDACSGALAEAAELCEGLSGRALRKLPFLAHTQLGGAAASGQACSVEHFVRLLAKAAQREAADRNCMSEATDRRD